MRDLGEGTTAIELKLVDSAISGTQARLSSHRIQRVREILSE